MFYLKSRKKYFNINIYYHHSRFLEPGDINFCCLYFETCIAFSHLCMCFAQVTVRMCFNKFKSIENSFLDYIFDTTRCENLSDAKHLKKFHLRKIVKICKRQAAHLFYCLRFNVKTETFAEMLENFRHGVDYKPDYFKIINQHYLNSLK